MRHLQATPAARTAITTGLKLALGAGLLLWLARSGRLDFHVFAALDARARLWLAVAALFQGLMIVAMAARWKSWLQVFAPDASNPGLRARLSWREAFLVTARGSCVGAWTPAGLGLDGIRFAHALRRFQASSHVLPPQESDEPSQSQPKPPGLLSLLSLLSLLRGAGAGSTGVARVVGMAALLDRVVALAALLVLALPFLVAQVGSAGKLVALACFMVAALGVALQARRRAMRARAREDSVSSSGAGHIGWSHVGWGLAWSVATHVANLLALGAVLEALLPGLRVWRALGLAFEVGPVIVLSGAVPLTPLGLGVSDATGAVLLAHHGLSCGGEAVMLGRAIWLGVCLLAGLSFWMRLESTGQAAQQ